VQTTSQKKLWSRDFVLLSGSSLLLWASFYCLVPTLPLFAVERLQCSESQVGLISGAMTITAIVARLLAGYALDRWGRRWIHIVSLVAFCAVMLSHNLVRSMLMLLVIRLLVGIPFGVSTTASITVAADLVPAARRGEGMGHFGLAQTVAVAVAPVLALWLLGDGQFTRVFTAAGWIALGAALLACLVRHPRVPDPDTSFSLRSIVEKRVLWLSLTMLFIRLGVGSVVAFITLYAAQLRIPNAGLFFSLYAAGVVVSRSTSGRFFDRRGPGLVVGLAVGSLFVSYVVLALWQTGRGFLCAAFVMGLAIGAIQPSLEAMVVNMVPAARRGAANATLFSAVDIGMGLGPSLLGVVAQVAGGYATMYLVAGGILLIPALLFFGVVMPKYGVEV